MVIGSRFRLNLESCAKGGLAVLHCLTPSYSSSHLHHTLGSDNREVQEALALVLADFGTRLKAMGNAAEAMAKYQQAVQLCPTCAAAHYNLGVITSEQRLVSRGMRRVLRGGCGGREWGRKGAAHPWVISVMQQPL